MGMTANNALERSDLSGGVRFIENMLVVCECIDVYRPART